MNNVKANVKIDAKGLACPMPIVKTKKAMNDLNPGEVLEVEATDKGSKADIAAWAKKTGHQYLGTIEEATVLRHYLRKASSTEEKEEAKYPHTLTNDELKGKLGANENMLILDVREPAEFAFGHIPGAVSIPFGELEARINELGETEAIYVVCRTGSRSDMASQLLADKGFANVKNVIPGMSEWDGPSESKLN